MFFETPEARLLRGDRRSPVVLNFTDKGRFKITLSHGGGWAFHDPLGRTADRIFLARSFAILHARAIEAYERGDELEADRILRMTDYEAQCRALGRRTSWLD